MKHHFRTKIAILLTVSLLSLSVSSQNKIKQPTRHALLIKISDYGKYDKRFGRKDDSPKFENLSGEGMQRNIDELESVLSSRYGFTDIKRLKEEEATREGILQAIHKLIAEAEPGDICVLYYIGHGSRTKNTGTTESNQKDETIVPIDYVRQAKTKEDFKDIRDKELAALGNLAVDKGIIWTAFFDSCYSGSVSRSGPNTNPDSTFDVAQLPVQFASKEQRKPGERGALIFSAAQATELAGKTEIGGDFSHALLKTLKEPFAESLSAVAFAESVSAEMARYSVQTPVLDANNNRKLLNIFGLSPLISQSLVLKIEKVDRSPGRLVATLNLGQLNGITKGSVLTKKDAKNPIRLRVSNVSLTHTEAIPLDGAGPNDLVEGHYYELTEWAAAKDSLRVWLPPANLSVAELQAVTQEVEKLKNASTIDLVNDPTASTYTHLLFYDGKSWSLKDGLGEVIILGRDFSSRMLLEKLNSLKIQGKINLFVSLPLAKEIKEQLRISIANQDSSLVIVEQPQEALYHLVGCSFGCLPTELSAISYGWVSKLALTHNLSSAVSPQAVLQPTETIYPIRSDWLSAKKNDEEGTVLKLNRFAKTLALIHMWMTMSSQGNAREDFFPYELAIREAIEITQATTSNQSSDDPCDENKKFKGGRSLEGKRVLEEGRFYKFYLKVKQNISEQRMNTQVKSLNYNDEKWVYIIGIDSYGNGVKLYPSDGKNVFQLSANLSPEISLEGAVIGVYGENTKCKGVLGIENYILLVTDKPLSPGAEGVLSFNGIRSYGDENGRVPYTRSPMESLSGQWLIQRLHLISVSQK